MISNKNNSNQVEYTIYTMYGKEAGIIDSTKVTRVALENAASVAGMLLTTECVITEVKSAELKTQYCSEIFYKIFYSPLMLMCLS